MLLESFFNAFLLQKVTKRIRKMTRNRIFCAELHFTSFACVFFHKNLFFIRITVESPTLYSFAMVLIGTFIVRAFIRRKYFK